MNNDTSASSGVQQLIDRLHQEGVTKGQSEAQGLLAQARAEAAEILDKARREAEQIVTEARKEAERTRTSGEDAVRMAGRDAILELTEALRKDFERKLYSLVGHSLKDTEFLKQLILQIAQRAVPAETGSALNVLLLADDSSRQNSEVARQQDEKLNEFVHSLSGETLRDGLTFQIANHETPGVRVQVVDQNLEIDLTTETLTHLLLKHLTPRFRKILQQS